MTAVWTNEMQCISASQIIGEPAAATRSPHSARVTSWHRKRPRRVLIFRMWARSPNGKRCTIAASAEDNWLQARPKRVCLQDFVVASLRKSFVHLFPRCCSRELSTIVADAYGGVPTAGDLEVEAAVSSQGWALYAISHK